MSAWLFRKSRVRLVLASLLTVVIVILVQFYFALSPKELEKHCLFFPVKCSAYNLPESIVRYDIESVSFKSKNGTNLFGLLMRKPNSKYVFLLHSCQGGNIETNIALSEMILKSGSSVFAYDYQGYGMSAGSPSCKNLLADGLAANDYLVNERKIDQSRIIQYGVSLGTGVASNVAFRRPSAGLVLFSPYTSMKKCAKETFPFLRIYPDQLFPEPDLGSLEFISTNTNAPVFIWHGGKDRLIDVSHTKALSIASSIKLTVYVQPEKEHGGWEMDDLSKRIGIFVDEIERNRSGKPPQDK